jgi:hypothetical protein
MKFDSLCEFTFWKYKSGKWIIQKHFFIGLLSNSQTKFEYRYYVLKIAKLICYFRTNFSFKHNKYWLFKENSSLRSLLLFLII